MKMKFKTTTKDIIISFLTLTLILILIFGGYIYYKIPKRYCKNIERVEKVELEGYCSEFTGLCVGDIQLIPDNTIEMICEDGVDSYSDISVRIRGYAPKLCLFKIVEEECEIR